MNKFKSPLKKSILFGATIDHSLLYITGLPERLVSLGWEVHIVCSPGTRLEKYKEVSGVHIHPIQMTRNPSPFRDLISFIKWFHLLRRVSPSVVSIGTPKASLLGLAAAWFSKVPIRIYFLHGLRLESSTGMNMKFLIFVERLTNFFATETISVSKSLESLAISLKLVSAGKIHTVGSGSANGVDINVFKPQSANSEEMRILRSRIGLKPNVPVIGFVGRINKDKGIFDLYKALNILKDRGLDFQLLLVGGADDIYGVSFLQAVKTSGLTVFETGFIEDPSACYSLMDILVLPSYREGFPTVVLEAAACGIMTITTEATGAIDSVIDGVTGAIVPVASPRALAAALEHVILDPKLRSKQGEAALKRVHLQFCQEIVQRAYIASYGAALQSIPQ